jgi:hypothetical protein
MASGEQQTRYSVSGSRCDAIAPAARLYQETVLPGGRNSGLKVQKGRGKKVDRKNLWQNFGRILPKVAVKGPKKISTEVSYFTVMTILRDKDKI